MIMTKLVSFSAVESGIIPSLIYNGIIKDSHFQHYLPAKQSHTQWYPLW